MGQSWSDIRLVSCVGTRRADRAADTELSSENVDATDRFIERRVERRRDEYRDAYRSYLNEFSEDVGYIRWQDYLL